MTALGRLERVEPREVWAGEAESLSHDSGGSACRPLRPPALLPSLDGAPGTAYVRRLAARRESPRRSSAAGSCNRLLGFTPWLAREENLALLGEALRIELELEAQEKKVGDFRADILCKDLDDNAWVLIENQLEPTDHRHLGQLLTYAAGLDAAVIVWIAVSVREEHRAALDWLNAVTDERFKFFGLEVELWRIGSSPAAPKFNVVSKPNGWSRDVKQVKRAIDEGGLSETRLLQLEYWAAFNATLEKAAGRVRGNRKPRAQGWTPYSIGKSKFNLAPVMVTTKHQLRAELYVRSFKAKTRFAQLYAQREAIEAELGYPLVWEELPGKQDCRIAIYHDADPTNRDDWPRQHAWLAERLNELHKVFAPRVKALDLGGPEYAGEGK